MGVKAYTKRVRGLVREYERHNGHVWHVSHIVREGRTSRTCRARCVVWTGTPPREIDVRFDRATPADDAAKLIIMTLMLETSSGAAGHHP